MIITLVYPIGRPRPNTLKSKPVKTLYTAKGVCLLLIASVSVLAGKAQVSLEFASGGGPAGGGVSSANQVVTFKQNTDNPSGNTFVAYSTPTTTTTFSFTNQQYTLPTSQMSTGLPMVFGAAINNGGPKALNSLLYAQMSSLGAPANNNFTSTETTSPGTGISITNNYGTEFMISAMPLYNAGLSTSGRFYMGDMNITFSSPLTDPVIHLVGIGAFYTTLGFTSEFDLQTAGVTLSRLSGCTELSVSGNKILNTAAHPSSTTGSGAATGSILAKGINITSLTFKVYLQGDGGAAAWASNSSHSGDQMIIAVSTTVPTLQVMPVTLRSFTATPQSDRTLLHWTMDNENNINVYDIQYSTNGISWQSIGTVNAANDGGTESTYSFVHANPAPGANYYRLQIVDRDNNSTWSPTVEQSFDAAIRLAGYPNPTRGSYTITGFAGRSVAVTVMTLDGRPLQQIANFAAGSSLSLSQYPAGAYFISVKDNGKTQLLKVFKE